MNEEYLISCACCKRTFDVYERIDADKLDTHQLLGVLAQICYCSTTCKRRANNKRYYARYQERIKQVNREAIRKRRNKE